MGLGEEGESKTGGKGWKEKNKGLGARERRVTSNSNIGVNHI